MKKIHKQIIAKQATAVNKLIKIYTRYGKPDRQGKYIENPSMKREWKNQTGIEALVYDCVFEKLKGAKANIKAKVVREFFRPTKCAAHWTWSDTTVFLTAPFCRPALHTFFRDIELKTLISTILYPEHAGSDNNYFSVLYALYKHFTRNHVVV